MKIASLAASEQAIYSASVDQIIRIFCFFDFQDTAALARRKVYPLVDFWSPVFPYQSESVKPYGIVNLES